MQATKRTRWSRWVAAVVAMVVLAFLLRTYLFKSRAAPAPVSGTHVVVVPPRPGILEFTDTPLTQVATHFATANGAEITVAPEVATLRIGGRFAADNVDGFLRMLAQVPRSG